jgi:hypothetical protein
VSTDRLSSDLEALIVCESALLRYKLAPISQLLCGTLAGNEYESPIQISIRVAASTHLRHRTHLSMIHSDHIRPALLVHSSRSRSGSCNKI